MDFDATELAKLTRHIEENIRTSGNAGLEFLDPRNYAARLTTKQNHLVYGRRGAGKSTLMKSLQKEGKHLAIFCNLETFKDIPFPNILVKVLIATLVGLNGELAKTRKWYRVGGAKARLQKIVKKEIATLTQKLDEPVAGEKRVTTTTSMTAMKKSCAGIQAGVAGAEAGVAQTKGKGETHGTEVRENISVDKLASLRTEISRYQDIFTKASKLMSAKPIFLILDDFYFIPKAIQPDLLDYFHRLTKGTPLFLKVATIKHRSRVYKQTEQSYVGVEPGHDILPIDMDYTLDRFDELKNFMADLLRAASKGAGASVEIDSLFSGDGFNQLCIASGGVPRDFLALFVDLADDLSPADGKGIGKIEVTKAAIGKHGDKLSSMKSDSAEEKEVLDFYLNNIKRTVYTDKRTNAFLVAKPDLENHPQSRQAIRELVDLRLLHLIESSTSSAPSDGRRYEAYLIDLGLYDNDRPRSFNQITPGSRDKKARKDSLRSSPRLSLPDIETAVSLETEAKLEITPSN
ncbi:MAG: hypothetical protein KKA42_05970 [candidate division Zixibacteria bacterium]|nr:hypothetical protein [candidate division Zixibacteria bacterium]